MSSFTRTIAELTSWPDTLIAQLTGKGTSTIQGYRLERLPEFYTAAQRRALVYELRAWLDDATAQVEDLELLHG